MENVSSNYAGSLPAFNSERPNSSSSIIDRIRQITESVLAKMDELYDKFGSSVYLIGFAGLTIAGGLSPAYFVAACILGASSIALLGFDWYLSGRHLKYLYNKIINEEKDLQLQLRTIQEEMNIPKLIEQINQSQSKEEYIENSKNISVLLEKFQKTIFNTYEQYGSGGHRMFFEHSFNVALLCLRDFERYDKGHAKEMFCQYMNDMKKTFQNVDERLSTSIISFEKERNEKA